VNAAPRIRRSASLLAAGALCACTVGPDYRAPATVTPPAYEQAASTARTVVSSAEPDLSTWWTQFNDPTLTALVMRALSTSPTLEIARSRIRGARLKEIEISAAAYPSLGITGSAVALRLNSGGSGAGAGSGLEIPAKLNLYSAGFDASWELDLFGANRRAREEALASTEASVWARRDGEVSLTAEIANDYLTLRSLEARIALGNEEVERQKQLFELIQARRRAGFVTNLDVNQQSTLVATAAAQIPALVAEASARTHALAVLLGEAPASMAALLSGGDGTVSPPPPTLPVGLPSSLLLRRPDLRAAERRLAASNAEIGVRTAAFYPKLDLMALPGFAGGAVGSLLSSDNAFVAGLGLVSMPVFAAGANRARVGEAGEAHEQAAAGYRIAVLGALRDVEDALAQYRAEESRRQSLVASTVASEATLGIAEAQYRTGFVTFANVLQAEYALLGARDRLAQSDALVVTDLVAIYKALGGGWTP
jgi:NodT family efflux transporter outer membrane factor (OMF) lipoprotein